MSSNLIPSAKVSQGSARGAVVRSSDSLEPDRRGAKRFVAAVVFAGGVLTGSVQARAQENDASRVQLDRVLSVLRLQQSAASRACLDVMSQVHATEQQVKDHQNDTGEHPDLDIARDVMESDYQNGVVICGADADRVCRTVHDDRLAGACRALHRDPP